MLAPNILQQHSRPDHGGNRSEPCPGCGAITRRRWCPTHDPDRAARKQAHAQRVQLYRQKAGFA